MDNSYTIIGHEHSASAVMRVPIVLKHLVTQFLLGHEIEIMSWMQYPTTQTATVSFKTSGLEYDMQCDLNSKQWSFSLRMYGVTHAYWDQWDRRFQGSKITDTETTSKDEVKRLPFTPDDFKAAKIAALRGLIHAD